MESVFESLQRPVRDLLENEGIAEPSEIQRLSIPPILDGRNVLLIAPTGTGKTHGAILPVFDRFLALRSETKTKGISILYVTPLRALNRDLLRRLQDMGKALDINVQVRHGDTLAKTRAAQARAPPQMLITTPETLQAILPGKRMREHLRNVRWLIIDEIHELATDKRGTQLSVAVERLQKLTGIKLQRIGLSATIGETEKIAQYLAGSSSDIVILKSEELKAFNIHVEHVTSTSQDQEQGEKLGIPPAAVARVRRICELIKEHESTLVFTNTREHAEALGSQIHAIYPELLVKVHHGSLSREIREEVEHGFQLGEVKAVICTSSLELGIDIGMVDYIIQFMSPREATRLVQRIGRSGHRIKGVATGCIISTWADDILESAVITKKAIKDELEPVKIHENALDVLAHQIAGLALEYRRIPRDEIFTIVRGAYPFRNLEPEEFSEVLEGLKNSAIIRLRDTIVEPRFPRAFRYYYENLSMIPDVKQYTVFDFVRKKRIGVLDQEFVARRCTSGTEFILHGHTWKVVTVNEADRGVEVEPTAPSLNAIPGWEGEIIPVHIAVTTEVGRLREEILQHGSQKLNDIAAQLNINQSAISKAAQAVQDHAKEFPIPSDDRIVIETYENCIIVHVCYGNLVNEVFGLVLATLLSAKYGANIATQVDQYRIALISPFKINANVVYEELSKLTPDSLQGIVEGSITKTGLFAWRHWHVAKRFGAVERTADYKSSRARLLVDVFRNTPINKETQREIYQEKMDLEDAKAVAQRIAEKKIQIELVRQRGPSCSALALPIVDKIVPHEILRPAVPIKSLSEIIKERLMSHNLRLVCLFNGDWEGVRNVRHIPEKPKCPKCGATLIAVTYSNNQELLGIVKKKKAGRKLNEAEQEAWQRAWDSAGLVQTAGKKAIITLAARGVGPSAAKRILRKYYRDESEFYVEILKAEREYARTRIFWD